MVYSFSISFFLNLCIFFFMQVKFLPGLKEAFIEMDLESLNLEMINIITGSMVWPCFKDFIYVSRLVLVVYLKHKISTFCLCVYVCVCCFLFSGQMLNAKCFLIVNRY